MMYRVEAKLGGRWVPVRVRGTHDSDLPQTFEDRASAEKCIARMLVARKPLLVYRVAELKQ